MKVLPQDLVPGCLLIKDVMGKTVYPIIPKNTVIEPIHIKVLNDFQVPYVEVASRLVSGDSYDAKEVDPNEVENEETMVKDRSQSSHAFFDYYVHAVKETKLMFENWEKHPQLDIKNIRQLISSLVAKGEESIKSILELHHYNEKQNYYYHHMVAIAVISAFIANKLKYEKSERMQIALAAFLSDAGMVKEGSHVYKKDDVLSEAEYERIQNHPILSYRMIEHEPYLSKNIKLAVLQHHERLDGSGYPLGIHNDKLHPYAKIIAVSDMFHAMTSERNYRKKQSPFKVIEEMMKDQLGKLDMKVVEALVQSIVYFSNGTKVRLTNNDIGEIVFIDDKHPTRPMVKKESSEEIIHLLHNQNLYIEEILNS